MISIVSQTVPTYCRKASGKTKALLRIRPFLSSQTAKSLCNAYILSPFNYCPLIWMNFSKSSNSQLNRLHQRSLRAVFLNFNLNFDELLALDKGVSLHISSMQKLLSYNNVLTVSSFLNTILFHAFSHELMAFHYAIFRSLCAAIMLKKRFGNSTVVIVKLFMTLSWSLRSSIAAV